MEKKRFTTPFREFITRDDSGRYHVRLGPQAFSTNYSFSDIRIESENGGTPVDPELLKSKPWILRNLQQEVSAQRKNEREAMYSKDCFQRTPYSANQRMAYNNTKSNKGL
ncbi:hypothetical protein GWP85_06995 [Acinetobacter beijerinckii]|uniref:hypothetical protein n=1 Tax=Acinetobacter beijerinckii TaxID=262668 RepID=UPI0023DE002C|nr:hypothetical protein [Acinetobacter beijerinckii]MDF2417264.1 hypothetical protein [Acinetobacter beijerinckii]